MRPVGTYLCLGNVSNTGCTLDYLGLVVLLMVTSTCWLSTKQIYLPSLENSHGLSATFKSLGSNSQDPEVTRVVFAGLGRCAMARNFVRKSFIRTSKSNFWSWGQD